MDINIDQINSYQLVQLYAIKYNLVEQEEQISELFLDITRNIKELVELFDVGGSELHEILVDIDTIR